MAVKLIKRSLDPPHRIWCCVGDWRRYGMCAAIIRLLLSGHPSGAAVVLILWAFACCCWSSFHLGDHATASVLFSEDALFIINFELPANGSMRLQLDWQQRLMRVERPQETTTSKAHAYLSDWFVYRQNIWWLSPPPLYDSSHILTVNQSTLGRAIKINWNQEEF